MSQKDDRKLKNEARYSFSCYPCGFMFLTSNQVLMSRLAREHAKCTFDNPAHPADPRD